MKPFTSPFPRVLGWGWVGIVALLLLDIAMNGDDRAAAIAAAVLLLTVGGDYVLWLRPRVVPTPRGVRLVNPLRETFVPWPAFTWADVTDVLRVHAGDRAFRSWPLRETKRTRVRDNLRRARGNGDPVEQDPRDMRPVDHVAKQLRDEAERRKALPAAETTGEPVPTTLWSPDSLLAVGLPAVVLVATVVIA